MPESSNGNGPRARGSSQGFPTLRRSPRVHALLVTGLVAAVLTLGVLGCSNRTDEKPTATAVAPQYREQEVADARKAVCEAFKTSFLAIKVSAGKQSDDPNQQFMIATNARLAFQAASAHLYQVISENPATPPDLARNVRDLASAFEDLVLARLAEKPQPEVDPIEKHMDAVDGAIRKVCT